MRLMQYPWLKEVRFGVCLAGLLSLSLLAGCGGGGGGSSSSPIPTPIPTPTPTPVPTPPPTTSLSTSVITETGLTATLSESSSTVAVGGTVVYTETLTNTNATAVPIHFFAAMPTVPSAGLVFTGPAGGVPVSPLPGQPPLDNGSLAPGQSLTTTQTVTGFTVAGVYTATATFSNDVTANPTLPGLKVTAQ